MKMLACHELNNLVVFVVTLLKKVFVILNKSLVVFIFRVCLEGAPHPMLDLSIHEESPIMRPNESLELTNMVLLDISHSYVVWNFNLAEGFLLLIAVGLYPVAHAVDLTIRCNESQMVTCSKYFDRTNFSSLV